MIVETLGLKRKLHILASHDSFRIRESVSLQAQVLSHAEVLQVKFGFKQEHGVYLLILRDFDLVYFYLRTTSNTKLTLFP